jgi:uncharacterized protein YjaG (DUF416 family)
MSLRGVILASACWCFCVTSLVGQELGDGPTNEKAQKTFKEALALEQKHDIQWAPWRVLKRPINKMVDTA